MKVKALFVFFFLCCLQTVAHGQKRNALSVLEFELRRFEAMMHADTHALNAMLSDDLIYVHSNALVENKEEHLRAIAQQKLIYKTMKREDARVRYYGKAALVNGTVAVEGKIYANDFAVRLLYSAVYQRHRKSWKLVNWQSTRIP
ncbi:MAG: nuclear transport factor 2 family protein [Saprospiraceae bacterium]|nr:nuclear transport factor 2 family protein [Saprospiraceae bacterium]